MVHLYVEVQGKPRRSCGVRRISGGKFHYTPSLGMHAKYIAGLTMSRVMLNYPVRERTSTLS